MRRTRRRGDDAEEALRAVKREKASGGGGGGDGVDSFAEDESTRATRLDRRVLRSKYSAVKNMIKGIFSFLIVFTFYIILNKKDFVFIFIFGGCRSKRRFNEGRIAKVQCYHW